MKTLYTGLCGLFFMASIACGPNKNSPEMEEAFQYHQEALSIRKYISKKLQEQENKTSDLHPITLQSLKEELEEWDKSFVEVSGHGHDHDNDHDHDQNHHHNPAPDLTNAEHLNLQKHLLEEIKNLKKKTDHVLIK